MPVSAIHTKRCGAKIRPHRLAKRVEKFGDGVSLTGRSATDN